MRANREIRARAGKQMADEARAAARNAARQAALKKLPRPTAMQRAETSVQLHLRRDKQTSADALVRHALLAACQMLQRLCEASAL